MKTGLPATMKLMNETTPAGAFRTSLARDALRDWRGWTGAERAALLCIMGALIAEISLSIVAGAGL